MKRGIRKSHNGTFADEVLYPVLGCMAFYAVVIMLCAG